MAALQTSALNLSTRHLGMLQDILRQTAPHSEVWAYGSRVTGTGHEASDLDLVVRKPRDPESESPEVFDLKDALVESGLPIRVDVLDWARIPADFKSEIEKQYVVVQKGTGHDK